MTAVMWLIVACIVCVGSILFVLALMNQSHNEDEWAERTFEEQRWKQLTEGKEKPCGHDGKHS